MVWRATELTSPAHEHELITWWGTWQRHWLGVLVPGMVICDSDPGKQILKDFVCDGNPDCPGGEDETEAFGCARKCNNRTTRGHFSSGNSHSLTFWNSCDIEHRKLLHTTTQIYVYISSLAPLCASQPCLNGGTCNEDDSKTFSCLCTPDWTGPTCAEGKGDGLGPSSRKHTPVLCARYF